MKSVSKYIRLQPPSTPVYASSPIAGNSLSVLGSAAVSIVVDPVVIFSVLDHELRRPTDQQRAIGALLGVHSEDGSDTVEVKNSFPVSYKSNENGELIIDRDHFSQMHQLYLRVNPKEVLVGWYATGGEPDVNTVVLHEDFFADEVSQEPSIHIVVHTLFNNIEDACIKAYVARSLGIPGDEENDGRAFIEIPCELQTSDVEKATLDVISKAATSSETRSGSIEPDVESLTNCMDKLRTIVASLEKYAEEVSIGKREGNPTIGRYLMDAISEVPKIDREEFEKVFSKNLQDNIMVAYLANLTRAQLTIADKLYTIA